MWLHNRFPSPTVVVGDQTRRIYVGGDKGYYNVKSHLLGAFGIVLTDSAVAAAAEDGAIKGNNKRARQNNFLARNQHSMLEARFATHRSVVERVIGAMKRVSRFVAGPIREMQADSLRRVLLIVAALLNRRLQASQTLFVN